MGLAEFCKMLNPQHTFSNVSIFYVYAYYMPGAEKPFYIGKGSGERAYKHAAESNLQRNTLFYNTLRKLLKQGLYPDIRKLYENLTEEEAITIEIRLIKEFGRIDLNTGCLCNHTDGGDGASGHIYSLKSRRRMSISAQLKETSIDTRIKRSYNASKQHYTVEHKLQKSKRATELRGAAVESYDLKTGQTIKKYESISSAAKEMRGSTTSISQCAKGRRLQYRSLGWRYI